MAAKETVRKKRALVKVSIACSVINRRIQDKKKTTNARKPLATNNEKKFTNMRPGSQNRAIRPAGSLRSPRGGSTPAPLRRRVAEPNEAYTHT